GEDEHVVLSISDLDAVSVGPGKPAFGHLGHGLAAASEAVFHVQELALGLEIVGSWHIHREPAAEEREEVLLHHGCHLATSGYLVSRSPGQQLLLNEGEFLACHVLKGKLVADAKGSPIDEKHVLASLVP